VWELRIKTILYTISFMERHDCLPGCYELQWSQKKTIQGLPTTNNHNKIRIAKKKRSQESQKQLYYNSSRDIIKSSKNHTVCKRKFVCPIDPRVWHLLIGF